MPDPYVNIHTHKPCKEYSICIENVAISELQKEKTIPDGFFSCGIHPWFIESEVNTTREMQKLEEIMYHNRMIAVGEAGLDKQCDTNFNLQKETFKKQILLSEKIQKPLIIHCVKTFEELLNIKKESYATQQWIIHGFSSSGQMAQQLISKNCMLSFGQILFKPESKACQTFTQLSPDVFFLETDDAAISIKEVYEKAAKLRNTNKEELKKQQMANFERIFNINLHDFKR